MSDHKDNALLLPALAAACELLGDRGYNSNCFRAALTERGITACYSVNPLEQSRAAIR